MGGRRAVTYDLVIRNGMVIDGSGLPGFHADVAVSDAAVRSGVDGAANAELMVSV